MDEDGWFSIVGNIAGGLGGLVAFIAIYLAAVGSVGWVFGLALGWIPAYMGALLVFFILRYTWWLALIGIAALVVELSK